MRSDPFMALLFVFLTSSLWHVEGFSTRSIPRPAGVSTSRQYLKPQQGSELVEASEHVYRHYEKDEDERTDYEGHQEKLIKVSLSSHHHPTVEKHRSFVRRAFSLPSYLWHPHAKVEGVRIYEEDNGTPQDGKQDVVYFPVRFSSLSLFYYQVIFIDTFPFHICLASCCYMLINYRL